MAEGLLIYRDFRQPHNPLLYVLLQPAVDPDEPVASFQRSRWTSASVLIGILLLAGWCAWRLGGPSAGVLATALGVAHSTLVERGQEVRPDGPIALCFVAALAVELSDLPRLRRYVLEAVLLSLAFLFTNKAVFGCFAFGCLWLVSAVRERSLRLVALPMAAWLAPVAITFGVMAWAGCFQEFFELNVMSAFAEASGQTEHTQSFPPGGFLVWEGRRNLLFSGLALVGLTWGGVRVVRHLRPVRSPEAAEAGGVARREGGVAFLVFLAVVLLASLWLNPFPYPYLHVTVLPVLAVLVGTMVGRFLEARGLGAGTPGGLAALVVLALLALATSFPRLTYLASLSQDFQMTTLRQVQRATGPDDAVFDMVGLYFRRDGHFAYLMTSNTFARYRMGGLAPIPDEIRRTGTVAFLYSYRIRWLEGEDQRFLQEHFTHYDGNLFLLGTPLVDLGPGESRVFEVLVGKRFRHDGDGEILVDGRPFEEGFLAAGEHVIERVGEVAGDRLIMDSPGPHPWPPRPPEPLYVNFD
jgi:hypothetical protein